MERKEIIERLNEIKRVVDSNTLEELIEAYPDAAGFSLCKESTFISIVGISSFLVNKLIKDIEMESTLTGLMPEAFIQSF